MADARMTVHECCEALRANGMSIGEAALTQMICEGKIPGAVGTRSESSGKAVMLIFRAAFYRWLDEMIGGEAVRAYE